MTQHYILPFNVDYLPQVDSVIHNENLEGKRYFWASKEPNAKSHLPSCVWESHFCTKKERKIARKAFLNKKKNKKSPTISPLVFEKDIFAQKRRRKKSHHLPTCVWERYFCTKKKEKKKVPPSPLLCSWRLWEPPSGWVLDKDSPPTSLLVGYFSVSGLVSKLVIM